VSTFESFLQLRSAAAYADFLLPHLDETSRVAWCRALGRNPD
jgi:hypothetical protein